MTNDLTPTLRYQVRVLTRGWVWDKDTDESVAHLLGLIGDYQNQTSIVELSTMRCIPWEHFERVTS